ncbi:MAG: hypothetical protein AAGB35_09750 [Pseudomonadota bacterium]
MNTAANKTELLGSGLEMHMASDLSQAGNPKNTFIVSYGDQRCESDIHIPTLIFGTSHIIESWQGMFERLPIKDTDWDFYHNEQYLIAAIPTQLHLNLPIDRATEVAYSELFKQIEALGYPYLLRTWNYLPQITHAVKREQNNYQLFCSGRSRAYKNSNHEHDYPAATVVGTQQEGLHIYFIAGKTLGSGIENPQQVSAFHYPAEYSEDRPLFSRALYHRNNSQEIFFVSGTASIKGHQTLHKDDVIRQLEVCLDNISHLIDTCVSDEKMNKISTAEMTQLKVYIKHANDFDHVKSYLENNLDDTRHIYYLQSDLCRDDLLVEIEALTIQTIK